MIYHLKKATRHLLFWSLIVGAIGSVVMRLLLSGLEHYKDDLEQQFYQLTEVRVKIGTLQAGMRGFNPQVRLQDIEILSTDDSGDPAIELQEIRLGLDVAQLVLTWDLYRSSWLTLVGARVSVVRQQDGSIVIKGLHSGNERQPLWLAQGGEYELLNSKITLYDEMRRGQQVEFENLSLLIKNSRYEHEIHLLTHLAEDSARSLRLSARFNGKLLNGEATDGRFYLQGDSLDLAQLIQADLPMSISLNQGTGNFELWGEWQQNRLQNLMGSLAIQGLDLQRTAGVTESLYLETLNGQFGWKQTDSGHYLSLQQLIVQTGAEIQPQAIDLSLYLGQDQRFSTIVRQLDLQTTGPLMRFFLTSEQQATIPQAFEPGGQMKNFAFYLSSDRQRWAVNGKLLNASMQAADPAPQFNGVSLQVKGSQAGGDVLLACVEGSVFLPDLFRKPLSFDRVAGTLKWSRQDNHAIRLSVDELTASNADWNIAANYAQIFPLSEDVSPFLSLQLAFASVSEVTHVPDYLPVHIMGGEAVAWLDDAFQGGYIRNGEMILSGNPAAFPFVDGQGKFEAMFDVEQGVLSYHPEWPQLTDLRATAHFFGDSLRVNVHHARTEGIRVEHAMVEFPVLSDAEFLLVDGLARADIADGLGFIQQTPLHTVVDGLVAATDLQGQSNVELKLKIPLVESVAEQVEGVVHLDKAALILTGISLKADAIDGQLRFTEQGVFSDRLNGQLLGFPVTATITTDSEETRIVIDGRIDMAQLQKQLPFLANDFISGGSAYRARVYLPNAADNPATVTIDSSLQGVVLQAPEELAKKAVQRRPVRVSMRLPEGTLLPVTVNYDDRLKLALNIDRQQQTIFGGHIVYGMGNARIDNSPGVRLEVNRDEMDLAAWVDFLQARQGDSDKAALGGIHKINFSLAELRWKQQDLGALQLAIQRLDEYWQGSIDTPSAQGAIKIPVGLPPGKTVSLQMAHLDLSRLLTLDLPESSNSELQFPMLAINSEKLLWNGANLGKLELLSRQTDRGLHFEPLKVTGPETLINMTADWLSDASVTETRVNGKLASDNFGRFLARLGLNEDLKETAADIRFQLQWPGAPYHFSLATLQGDLQLQLRGGRIASIEPGLGRLLGLIAMEQWVKRFTLDFRDIYKKGLAFNRISGNFDIAEGKAVTDDLLLDAIAVKAKIYGEADLLEKTLDNRVLVVPKSSGAVPIAGTIVEGIATAITRVLTDDYKEGYFFGSEYRVLGPWGNVEVIPVNDQDGVIKRTWDRLTDFPWKRK